MTIALAAIVAVLLGIIAMQYVFNRTRSAGIRRLHEQLNRIVNGGTGEKLLLVTDDQELIPLLVEINRLLERNQQSLASHAKTEIAMKKMISNISHDLKTPLTVVLGYLETINLDMQMSQEERASMLSKVEKKTIEVLELIHKFFDLAKLESGDKDIPLTRIHLNEICRTNMLAFYDVLTAKGFEVHIDIPDQPLYVMGNAEAMDRILNNLISNAIQHGGDGNTIGLALREDEDWSRIEVWDKGKGIKELHRDQVFERMYTLEDSRNSSYQGSGLGLTITKRLVESLGGTIHLYSKPYEKTAFSFSLKKIRY